MEHENPLAQSRDSHLEAGAVRRERVAAHRPLGRRVDARPNQRSAVGVRASVIALALVVVEHDLEHPVGGVELRRGDLHGPASLPIEKGYAVAVVDPLEIPVSSSSLGVGRSAVRLVRQRDVDAGTVFWHIGVARGVALVVARLADDPAVDPRRVARIGDARLGRRAIQREHVVLAERTPVHIARIAGPAFDPSEEPFDPRPVPADGVARRGRRVDHAVEIGVQFGDEIVGARK